MRIKIYRKNYFISGVAVVILLFAFYFIKINVESGANYNTQDSLLGIIIFHNPFILGIYILVSVVLIVKGTRNLHKI